MSWATATGFQLNRITARRFEKCTCRAEAASWSQPVGKPNSQSKSVPKRPSTAAPGDSSKAIEAKAVVSSTNVTRRGSDDALPLSLFAPFDEGLPYDGETQTEFEVGCDPMTRNCQTMMHVWESTCRPCFGTGSICSSNRRGHRSHYVCLMCHGLGVVRKTSSRIIPDVNSGNGQFTINRPAAPIPEEGSKHPRLDRFKNRKNT